MSWNLRAFSSLAAKRRYTLKSPALAILKLNMYDRLCLFQAHQAHTGAYSIIFIGMYILYVYFRHSRPIQGPTE